MSSLPDHLLDVVSARHPDWVVTRDGGGVRAVHRTETPDPRNIELGIVTEVRAVLPVQLDHRLTVQDELRRPVAVTAG